MGGDACHLHEVGRTGLLEKVPLGRDCRAEGMCHGLFQAEDAHPRENSGRPPWGRNFSLQLLSLQFGAKSHPLFPIVVLCSAPFSPSVLTGEPVTQFISVESHQTVASVSSLHLPIQGPPRCLPSLVNTQKAVDLSFHVDMLPYSPFHEILNPATPFQVDSSKLSSHLDNPFRSRHIFLIIQSSNLYKVFLVFFQECVVCFRIIIKKRCLPLFKKEFVQRESIWLCFICYRKGIMPRIDSLPEMGNYLAFHRDQREKQVHLGNSVLVLMSSPYIILASCHCALSLRSLTFKSQSFTDPCTDRASRERKKHLNIHGVIILNSVNRSLSYSQTE